MDRAELLSQIALRGFINAGALEPAIIVAPVVEADDASGAFTFPTQMLLPEWRLEHLPGGPAFIEQLPDFLSRNPGRPVLVIPPMGSRASVRQAGSPAASMELHEAAAFELAANLESEAVGAVLLPASTLVGHRGRKARSSIFSRARPCLVTFLSGLPGLHPTFSLAMVHLRCPASDSDLLRLFSVPAAVIEAEVLGDLDRLLRMQGGRSNFGYVIRETLPLEESLTFERHDPLVLGRREELRAFGPVKRLGDLFEIIKPMRMHPREQFVPAETPNAWPVLAGRNITSDGSLDLGEIRDWTLPDPAFALEAGDIVIRSLMNERATSVNVAVVHPSDLPLAPGPHLHVLRPSSELADDERSFIAGFLRSARAFELMRAEGATLHLGARHLLDLEVPVPDAALSAALNDLVDAASQFEGWRREADALTRSVFNEGTAEGARLQVLQSGEVVRQRARAAALMDDQGHRIRSLYPYPIAYRWRTVEASTDSANAVPSVVECAEVLLCYCAMVALLFARTADREIRYLATIRERLAEHKQGTNLGDWVAILTEVRDSRDFRDIPTSAPFAEIRNLLREPEVEDARQRLKARRDNLAHYRSSGPAEEQRELEDATSDLRILLEAAGFLADYTLNLVSATAWDSLRGLNRLTIRELMGDHPVVPPRVVQVPEVAIESGSLYLVDRARQFHLARPFLLEEKCPACGNWSTFHLDTFDPEVPTCSLKSLEHGHTMERPELVDAFRSVQLLQ